MTNAPIIRSAQLRQALAMVPVTRTPAAGLSFAATLKTAQRNPHMTLPKAAPPRPATPTGTVAPTPSTISGPVPYLAEITAAAHKYGIDPALLAGVVKQESNFNPKAQSPVGAKGLTQLMDATARGLGVTDSFDPQQSLDGGARFLAGLLKQFHGDESLAVAAYNAGPGAVQKYGGIPPYQETQRYVPKVLGYAAQFRRIIAAV